MSYSDKKWKEYLIWKHDTKTIIPKQFTKTHYNRYYNRGFSPYKIDTPKCCNSYLEHNRKYGNTVVSKNNPYSDDNPGFSDYFVYSFFPNKVLSNNDIYFITKHYNNNIIVDNPERLYGPFTQRNLNIISETAYNEENWNQNWKKYNNFNNLNEFVFLNIYKSHKLYHVAYNIALEYTKAMNVSLNDIHKGKYMFNLARNKIISLSKSIQTEFIKYIMNVSLFRNIESKMYDFEVLAYYNTNNNKLYLGKTTFIGSGTTDSILLPNGKDSNIFENTGRPVHPLEAKKSEMINEEEANNLYIKYLYFNN